MKEASYHLTLLAQNRQGFRNLIKLASAAFLEGFYFKPRIDRELLAAHSEGLICLSGCVSGELSRTLLSENLSDPVWRQAQEVAAWFQGVFGDRYFIEIQNNGLEIQRLALERSVEIARRMGLPVVATSDAHYVNREDAEAQDVLLCINTGKYRTDKNRMRMEGDQFFLRAPDEMYAALAGHEDALRQSQAIADSVDIELELGQRHFPNYTPPAGKTPADFLRELCISGLKQRYAGDATHIGPDGQLAEVVVQRLQRELGVINTLGFANYFLICWDFVRYAREQKIPATARGSGVGSLVCYALYLSHVCPLKYDLLFERFLDESRLEAPDIDIDFCQDRRGEVIQYVKATYGTENVAQIGTFGTLAARAAIRDVGRALGMPIPRVDAVVALVPEELHITLKKALATSADLKRVYDNDAEVRELIDLAMKIEGLARNVGTHAAAVVIADRPLVEYVPLGCVAGKEEIITQWAMGDVEAAGLLKMDFLGLRNLTILSKSVELIEKTTGQRIDPHQFPLDDDETFQLLCRGETKGIFQLESGGIRDLLQKMKPDHFRDIIATNALYRPGPLEGGMVDDYVQVKHGRKPAEYLHPVMREVLEETHGVMVYQEQVMRILNRLGGIELSSAYTCIKAISKKNLPKIAKFREDFVGGAVAKGLSKNQAQELFGMIEKFAGYGFNKSHSTAYALIAYMTAYLKAHWPVEFMAALLSGDIAGRNFKKKDKLVEHLEDCRRMGIEVLAPDVNRAEGDFTVIDGKLQIGLAAIKGCGRRGRDGHRGGPCQRRAVSQPVRFLRTGRRPADRPGRHRNPDQGRRFRFARRSPLAVDGRGRSGRAGRRRPAGRSPPRTEGAVRGGRRRAGRSRAGRPFARRSGMGQPRAFGPRERSARLLSVEPSAGRAPANSFDLLFAQHAGSGLAGAADRSGAGGDDFGHQAVANQEPARRQHQHQICHVRSGGHERHHPLHSLAGRLRQFRPSGRGRRHSGRPRRGRSAARQRGIEPDRGRADPPGRRCRPLYAWHSGSHRRSRSTASAASANYTKSSGAIPAIANCSCCSAWPTAVGFT